MPPAQPLSTCGRLVRFTRSTVPSADLLYSTVFAATGPNRPTSTPWTISLAVFGAVWPAVSTVAAAPVETLGVNSETFMVCFSSRRSRRARELSAGSPERCAQRRTRGELGGRHQFLDN